MGVHSNIKNWHFRQNQILLWEHLQISIYKIQEAVSTIDGIITRSHVFKSFQKVFKIILLSFSFSPIKYYVIATFWWIPISMSDLPLLSEVHLCYFPKVLDMRCSFSKFYKRWQKLQSLKQFSCLQGIYTSCHPYYNMHCCHWINFIESLKKKKKKTLRIFDFLFWTDWRVMGISWAAVPRIKRFLCNDGTVEIYTLNNKDNSCTSHRLWNSFQWNYLACTNRRTLYRKFWPNTPITYGSRVMELKWLPVMICRRKDSAFR